MSDPDFTIFHDDAWVSVRKGLQRFEAYSVGGGLLKWRQRPLSGWRRWLPVRWTYGDMDTFDIAHHAFVTGRHMTTPTLLAARGLER